MQCFDIKKIMKNLGDSYNLQFIKQVPMHPRGRLVRATKNSQGDDDVKFTKKQTPAHPTDRLKRKKKTLKHPRDKMREKESGKCFCSYAGKNCFRSRGSFKQNNAS